MEQPVTSRDCLRRPCTDSLSFLDFPVTVRELIYELAGLPMFDVIRLVPGGNSGAAGPLTKDSSRLTLSLLQTCKLVHHDVMSSILYYSRLFVSPTDLEYGLDLLFRLTPQQCDMIDDLHVYLLHETEDGPSPWEMSTVRRDRRDELVAAWQVAAMHILTHARPGSLDLHLVCDATDDDNLTTAVIQPLLEFPGKLRSCELRLSAKRDARLSTLTLETASRATGNYTDPALRKGPFRFFELPQEIRRSILEYTDLVTPCRQVLWNPDVGFYCVFVIQNCELEECDPILHRGCRFRFCGWDVLPDIAWEDRAQFFCRAKHASYSSTCHCWAAPGDLMTVSRGFYHEAMAVFYSQNRITVTASRDGSFARATRGAQLDAASFFTRHRFPGVLRHIRTIELIFGPEDLMLPHATPVPPCMDDWRHSVEHFAEHANLANLTLVVHLSQSLLKDFYLDRAGLPIQLRWILTADEDGLFSCYSRLLPALVPLRGLKRLFIHLEAPWNYSPCGFDFSPSQASDLASRARRRVMGMEGRLERYVLGDEEYDSSALGKWREEEVTWLTCVMKSMDLVGSMDLVDLE